MADHHTVAGGDLTPSHPLLCPSGEFTLGFAMVHFLYQCGLAMVPQDSLDIAMKIFFFNVVWLFSIRLIFQSMRLVNMTARLRYLLVI